MRTNFYTGSGKKECFTVVVVGLSVFKVDPISVKTGVLKLCLFTRKYNIHTALLSFPNTMQSSAYFSSFCASKPV